MEGTEPCTEIPVWLRGTQRWVTGLTKRTTCDDVIYALLYNDGAHEDERTDKYTIYERWRDVERPLQGRTKILKIWKAWGDEQRNVQLTMRHINEFDEYGNFLHARRRHRRSRHKTRDGQGYSKERSSKHKSDRLKSVDELAKRVIKQERKLHDIGSRLENMDKEIEHYETNMHNTRVEANGTDYVQNAYLNGGLEDSMDEFLRKVDPENLEMYIQFCERVIQLDSKIKHENSKIGELTEQIDEEALNKTFCGEENFYDKEFCNSELETELTSLQAELNRIVSANMMQKYEAAEIAREIETCDKVLLDKQKTIQNLQKELEWIEKCELEKEFTISRLQPQENPSNAASCSDYVNIDSIFSSDQENCTTLCCETNQPAEPLTSILKKNFSDNDDTFSVDTDNTSNDSQFGYSKESTPKNGHRRNCLFIPQGKMFDDSLISERIKSEIYAYKSKSNCRSENDGFVSASMNNSSRSDCCAKVNDDDSNSDTGLSSMHSDDVPSYNFLETLV